MRNTIFLIVIISSFYSCSKSSSAQDQSLNSVENTIKGRWYLKSKSDSSYFGGVLSPAQTATYTTFKGTPYIEFLTTKSAFSATGGANAKDAQEAGTGLFFLNLGIPIAQSTTNFYWYYDMNNKMINYMGRNLTPVVATSNDLVLKFTSGDYSVSGFNITWRFKR